MVLTVFKTHLTYINWWKHTETNIYKQTKKTEQLKAKQKSVNLKTKTNENERLLISKLCTLSEEFEIPERNCDDNWKKSTHTYRKHFATNENKEKVVETPPKPKGTYTQTLRAVKTTTTTTTLIQRHIITEYIYREQTVKIAQWNKNTQWRRKTSNENTSKDFL